MNTHHKPARLLVLTLVAAAVTVCTANDKPQPAPVKPPPVMPLTEAELRPMLTKSLGFLAKEGEEWIAARSCNGCHHLPGLLWSHREAKRRGFAVDQAKFDEWYSWSIEQMSGKRKPGLVEAALMTLAVPEKSSPMLTQVITAAQKADGTWDPAQVMATMQKRKRGEPDKGCNVIRLCLVALAVSPATKEAEAARAKADVPLQKKDEASTLESVAFRSLFARRFGKQEEVNALRDDILKQQRGDGGWSLLMDENQSDPLATGEAIYVLQSSAFDPATAEAVARAQRWLLRTQRPDGSWPIDVTHISATDRSAPDKASSIKAATGIYTFWGCSWATLGLLQSVPLTDSPKPAAAISSVSVVK